MIAPLSIYSPAVLSFRSNKNDNKSTIPVVYPSKEKRITASEAAAYGVAAISTGLLLKNRFDINKFVSLIEKDVPKTSSGRIGILGRSATIDSLTSLGNKKNLMINALRDYESAIKQGKNFNIAMLDMDNFKSINENLGHPVGDIFLIRISKNAKEIAEKHGAKSYRFGGEEFVITATGKSADEMKVIMEEISASIKGDSEIQKYLPEFKKKAQEHLVPLEKELEFVQKNIFENLRKHLNKKDAQVTKDNIINFLKGYVDKYDPIDRSAIDEILTQLNSKNDKELIKFLNSDTKVGNETLKVQLDKLVAPYKESENDLLKWMNHVDRYNAFTVSGGYATIAPSYKGVFKSSEALIDSVDKSLLSAKRNGKNTVIEATESILDEASKA